jgi:hypothetical protein
MNHRDLVLRLLQTADQFNMDAKDCPALLIKATVLSLKYVDRKALFSALFPEHYADWGLVERTLTSHNTLGDAEAWLCLLSLVDWPGITDRDRLEIEGSHALLAQIKAGLRANNLDSPGWSTACRVLILQMIQGLQSMHAIELLTSRMLARSTREGTMQLLAGLYDTKHLPEAYQRTLCYVLSKACIDEATLSQTLTIIHAQREERKLNLRLKSMQMVALRPRLRDRLKTSLLTEQRKERVDSQLGTWDSYTGFCHTHRFPNNLSDRIKRQLYFLAAQTTWDWGAHVGRLIQGREIEERVRERPVQSPDLNIITWVIENLSMDGRPPFPEMMAFKARCFGSFPVVFVQRLTLTQVLRLYVAAYQAPDVWKEAWKAQASILSPQIIRDVETFVAERPFAGEHILNAMLN